jgi:hypothetical protein
VIANVSDREIDWVILVLAGSNRGGGLVTSKNNGDKHRPMCVGVHGNEVLLRHG